MKKNKIVILITSIIFLVIICVFSFFSIKRILENKKLKEDKIYIIIEQFKDIQGKERVQIYKELFDEELTYNNVINSIINKGNHNQVIIENGICKVINTTCPTHSCETYVITNSNEWGTNTTISCLPNGLYIYIASAVE